MPDVLTTEQVDVAILATMPKRPAKTSGAALVALYSKRQPRRPHYLSRLMERGNVTRAQLIEELGVDKGLVSKWLDEEKPTTPSPDWAKKLGRFFAAGPDPDDIVDIFADPDLERLRGVLRNRSPEEVERIIQGIETLFPRKTG